MCRLRRSIGSFYLPSPRAKSSAGSAMSTLDRHWGYLLSLQKLPNSLFAFILASSRELVSAASYSKSNPLILCLQFWAAAQSGSGSRRRLSFQDFFPFEACLQPAFSSTPQACWCLLVQHSCALLCCKFCCDPVMTDT